MKQRERVRIDSKKDPTNLFKTGKKAERNWRKDLERTLEEIVKCLGSSLDGQWD